MTTQYLTTSWWRQLLRPGPHFWAAFKVFLPLRIGFSLWAIIILAQYPAEMPASYLAVYAGDVSPGDNIVVEYLLEPWLRWDAHWYTGIAAAGYDGIPGATAFPPLYPLLIRWLGQLLGGQFLLAALLISNGAALAAFMLLHRLVTQDHGRYLANRTLVYLALFPAGFVFLLPYTESLFFMLVLGSLLVARQEKWAWAAVLGALATVTRWQGAVLVLPLGWLYLEARRVGRPWRQWPDWTWREWTHWLPSLWLGLIPAVLLGVFLWMDQMYGADSLPLAQYSSDWGAVWVWPWQTLVRVPLAWMGQSSPDVGTVCNWLVTVFFFALLLAAWRRVRFAYVLYGWVIFLPAAMRLNHTAQVGTMRYALVVFPAFIVVAYMGRRIKWLHNLWIIGGFVLALLFSFAYLQWFFII
ncbi:hypothetical protein ACFLYO_03325 [Chloroflexota bacterium]